MLTDFYLILQVHTDAEQEIIEAAYKRLARKYHPDINGTPDATVRMQKINEAYDVLSDPEKRRVYDQNNLQKELDIDALRRQLELVENQFLDEQKVWEQKEDELTSIIQELRIEQRRQKRAQKQSERMSDQIQHPPSFSLDAVSVQKQKLQKQIELVEKELVSERLSNRQMQEEFLMAARDLTQERKEVEKASRAITRLEQQLEAERARRKELETEKRLAEYERQAKDKVEALVAAEQTDTAGSAQQKKRTDGGSWSEIALVQGMIEEERFKRKQAENSLAAVRGILRDISNELKHIFRC